MRAYRLLTLALLLGGCRDYDRYAPIVDQDGLIAADRFATYGAEQAQAIAIGRAFGSAFSGTGAADWARQAAAGAKYAKSLPGVATVVADTTAHLLTVTFKSGWKKAITPIADGVPADQTPGLPAR